jgi:hypothetical protein
MMGVTPFWAGGDDKRLVYAIPANAEHTRWIPLTAEGTIATEPFPCTGYLPHWGVPSRDLSLPRAVYGWLKEYDLPSGKAYGWVSPDLAEDSGPRWRAMEEYYHGWNPETPYDYVLLGQEMDGSWMVYEIAWGAAQPHRAVLAATVATREAALAAWRPIRDAKRQAQALVDLEENRKRMIAWREYVKSLGIDSFEGLTPEQASALPSQLYSITGALARRDYNAFDSEWQSLPGDYYLRYMLKAYNLRRISLDPQHVREYAATARDQALAGTLRSLADDLERDAKAREEARKQEAEGRTAAAAAANARAAEPVPSWSSSAGSSLSASDRAYVESSRAHEQYMQQMSSYLGGQSAWRPYR